MPLTFEQFIEQAIKILNLNLCGYKIKRVQRRTDSLMRRHNINDYEQCIKLLKTDHTFKEAYLNHFTINTSEFFRNPGNFAYLKEKILPGLFVQKNKVNIWSAPCSNGSEPYTVALILAELNYTAKQYRILGSDIDTGILDRARQGVYGYNNLENVPDNLLNKYFINIDPVNRKYRLTEEIIRQVTLEKKDLINESFSNNWDLILSRNFFIYLTNEIKEMLCHKFAAALRPGGYFFLGNTEFIFNPEQYNLKKVYSSFYQKSD